MGKTGTVKSTVLQGLNGRTIRMTVHTTLSPFEEEGRSVVVVKEVFDVEEGTGFEHWARDDVDDPAYQLLYSSGW